MIQAIQPMLNISGFLSRIFNVLITGLKAILHWFLPIKLLEQIHSLSIKIFGYPEVRMERERESVCVCVCVYVCV
jgi:hypothetical protein